MKKIFILFLTVILSSCVSQSTSKHYLLSDMSVGNITLFEPGKENGSWDKQIKDFQSTMLYLEFFPKIDIKLYRSHGVVTIHSIKDSLIITLKYDSERKLYYSYKSKLPVTVIIKNKGIKLYMTFMDTVICFHDDI